MSTIINFGARTSAFEISETYASHVAGKVVLITGSTLGSIGDTTARAFAHGGASTVIITGRDDAKLSAASASLSKDYPKTTFRPLKLDLNSLKAVKQAAQEIIADENIKQIDFLIANAGLNTFNMPRSMTKDGIELHFGVNHLAHHLLIKLLLPKIRAAAKQNAQGDTRIVIVSSVAAAGSPIRFSDWNYESDSNHVPEGEKPNWGLFAKIFGLSPEPASFEANIAYGQSKTANILEAVHLNKMLADEGIYSFSLHPGAVASNGATELLAMLQGSLGEPKTLEQGAATTLAAALDPALKPEGGVFLNDCVVDMEFCPPYASDEAMAERLWKLSEDILESRSK
jgi:NAD(P)-dependent dehydrogenase (short-subunit alcohol dehydrogenase family)